MFPGWVVKVSSRLEHATCSDPGPYMTTLLGLAHVGERRDSQETSRDSNGNGERTGFPPT